MAPYLTKPKTRWKYHSKNAGGNVHTAVEWINAEHPDWDVVNIVSVAGGHAIIVWREEISQEETEIIEKQQLDTLNKKQRLDALNKEIQGLQDLAADLEEAIDTEVVTDEELRDLEEELDGVYIKMASLQDKRNKIKESSND